MPNTQSDSASDILSLNNNTASQSCFDPVAALPGDLAALCLSYVESDDLLKHAQRVSRAWRDAIDGGLPAVWFHGVHLTSTATDAQLAEVVRKSHGAMRTLTLQGIANLTVQGLDIIRSLSDLRHLGIGFGHAPHPFATFQPSFPLLEDLYISYADEHDRVEIEFPPLMHLKSVWLMGCKVKGVHNLSSLTKLDCIACAVDVDAEETWPASLRDVGMHQVVANPRVLDRIAAIPQLVAISTDWSFAAANAQHDPLSFLSGFTLQRLFVTCVAHRFPLDPLFNILSLMTSLRELNITVFLGIVTGEHLESVAQLTNLRELTITTARDDSFYRFPDHCLQIVSPILPQLHGLALSCEQISDYSLIASCSQLRRLRIVRPGHTLSLAEVQAISQLQHLESLDLDAGFADINHFSHLCALRSLRNLDFNGGAVIPATAFSGLPALCYLEAICIYSIKDEDLPRLVGCLVQMPKLRSVVTNYTNTALSAEDEQMLRDALPRLEILDVSN